VPSPGDAPEACVERSLQRCHEAAGIEWLLAKHEQVYKRWPSLDKLGVTGSQQPAATRQRAGLQRAVAWQQLLGEQALTLELLICVDILLTLPAQAGHPLLRLF